MKPALPTTTGQALLCVGPGCAAGVKPPAYIIVEGLDSDTRAGVSCTFIYDITTGLLRLLGLLVLFQQLSAGS